MSEKRERVEDFVPESIVSMQKTIIGFINGNSFAYKILIRKLLKLKSSLRLYVLYIVIHSFVRLYCGNPQAIFWILITNNVPSKIYSFRQNIKPLYCVYVCECKLLTSVIGRAGLTISGDSCFLVGDTGF